MDRNRDEIIVESGIALVKKYGAVFPIDELCTMINISKKTFYTHFPTKNHLMERILQLLTNKWKQESALHEDHNGNIRAAFLSIFLYHLDEITNFNTRFFSGLKLKFPQEYLIIDDYFRQVRAKLLKILQEGQKNNKVSSGYNLELFLEKETAFFDYLCSKHYMFVSKDDYVKLLELSLDGILINH
ncbi:MAG TPA: TetR/AcrR family transcriptional regulator [Cytophagales bacterium]|nr:TetR/AcrR family transcriptional regulator [Cytophagales bacterium]